MGQGQGAAKYGVSKGNSKGMPQGKKDGSLMNQTPPSTSGGTPPIPPKGTSARYGGIEYEAGN